MPRQSRLDVRGALHHIMTRGIDRHAILKDDQDKGRFLDRLSQNITEGHCFIYAWVLMDNHIHLLFRSAKQGISAVMRKLLRWYAQYYKRQLQQLKVCRSGGTIAEISPYRSREELGLSAADIARQLGVATASIPRAIERMLEGTG